jgi:glycosyltransferase involved in cell wall biosynthesis
VPMSDMATKPRAICILGMHRSGTSAIARAVNLLGAYLGEEKDLMPPSPDNPEGYWERADIFSLQERILKKMKRTWDMTIPLPDEWHTDTTIGPLKDEIETLIRSHFSAHPLWAWKDPRTSLLLPLWRERLDSLGINLSAIFVLRNPLDVARSLKKRDGIPYDKGFGIWFTYSLAALEAISEIPTVFVLYDRFLANWETELRYCAEVLKIDWPDNDIELRKKMNLFIRPDLRHSASTVEDLKKTGAPRPVVELYELFLSLIKGAHVTDPINAEIIVRLSSEFKSYASFFLHKSTEERVVPLQSSWVRFCQLYLDTGRGFNELESIRDVVTDGTQEIEFDLSKYPVIKNLRFDPIDDMVVLKIEDLSFITEDSQVKHTTVRQHNALIQKENSYSFATNDPQLYFDLPRDTRLKSIKIKLKYDRIGQDGLSEILGMMNQRLAEQAELLEQKGHCIIQKDEQLRDEQRQVIEKDQQLTEMAQQLCGKDRQLQESQSVINETLNSWSWKVTYPLRAIFGKLITLKRLSVLLLLKLPRMITMTNIKLFIKYMRMYGLRVTIREAIKAISSGTSSVADEKKIVSLPKMDFREMEDIPTEDVTVSVVIPTKNAGEWFSQLLMMIRKQRGIRDIEIIVVDSGSTDRTLEISRHHGAKIIEIAPEQFTHSFSRNLGAENATGEFLFFTVQDALIPSNTFFYHFLKVYKKNEVIAVSCAEFPREDADLFYRALCWNHYEFLGVNGHDKIMSIPPVEDFLTLRRNGQLSDLACFISKDVFMKYKYRYDYAEDLDLGLRLIRDGYKLAFLSSIKIIHSHNRPAYYFLKRGFVDQLFLTKTFPDYPLSAIEAAKLPKDILSCYEAINTLVGKELATLNLPHETDKFIMFVTKKFEATLKQNKTVTISHHTVYVDDSFKAFLEDIYAKCFDKINSRSHYEGVLAGELLVFLNTIFNFMRNTSDLSDVIDEHSLTEFKFSIYKAFALICGVNIANSYLRYPEAATELLAQIGIDLTAGI